MKRYFKVHLNNTNRTLTYIIPEEEDGEIQSIEVLKPETNVIDYWLEKN